jgi:hypothetical protein
LLRHYRFASRIAADAITLLPPAAEDPLDLPTETRRASCNQDVQSQKETRKNYSMTNGIAPQMHPFGVTSVAILRSSVRYR